MPCYTCAITNYMPTLLGLTLDLAAAKPIYLQLVDGIADLIARGAVHPGDALPSVRELALEVSVNQNTVQRAYGLLRDKGLIDGRAGQGTRVSLAVQLGKLHDVRDAELRLMVARLIAETVARGYTLAEVEAAFTVQRANWQTKKIARTSLVRQWIGLGSHDLCLEVVLAHCQQANPGLGFEFAAVGSMAGLIALGRGDAHFATAHLWDPDTDDYNLPFIRQLMPGNHMVLLTLAHRIQGFMLAHGNPRKIFAIGDLSKRGVRFINRPIGTGTRVMFDHLLDQAGLQPRHVVGYAVEADTVPDVAQAITQHDADVGMGTAAAARASGLDFVPLRNERYEIILPRASELLVPVLDVIQSQSFKEAARALGGYDLTHSGTVRLS